MRWEVSWTGWWTPMEAPVFLRVMDKTGKSNGHAYEYYLQPLSSIHLESQLDVEVEPNSNIVYIYVLAVIALFILFYIFH